MMMDPNTYAPEHFLWFFADGVATITLNRPDRKNPLTFESYAELRDLFRDLVYVKSVQAVIVTGAGGNFCSGGDVHEIIGPLVEKDMAGLLDFTRMTGDLVKAMRDCPQPVIAAVDGICVGAGAIMSAQRVGLNIRKEENREELTDDELFRLEVILPILIALASDGRHWRAL